LKTSSIEVEALMQQRADSKTQLIQVANRLHEAGVRRVFITRGGQGVFFSEDGSHGMQKVQRHKYDIRNAGGAGDAFLAGLAYTWLEDWDLHASVQFSLAAAGITLSHSGTNNPALSLAAVKRAMETQHD
jgi:pseudouridine kinase